jgi:hypothetical protein
MAHHRGVDQASFATPNDSCRSAPQCRTRGPLGNAERLSIAAAALAECLVGPARRSTKAVELRELELRRSLAGSRGSPPRRTAPETTRRSYPRPTQRSHHRCSRRSPRAHRQLALQREVRCHSAKDPSRRSSCPMAGQGIRSVERRPRPPRRRRSRPDPDQVAMRRLHPPKRRGRKWPARLSIRRSPVAEGSDGAADLGPTLGAAFSIRVAPVEEGGTNCEEGERVATEEHRILEPAQSSSE